MRNLVLVKKYATGLVMAVSGEAEFRSVQSDVAEFLEVYEGRKDLRDALTSPFIDIRRKEAMLEAVLMASGAGVKTIRFLRLLQEHKRLGLLREIAAALPEAWNEKLGILTFEASSVVPLTDVQKARLRKELEAAEGRPVRLSYRLDPSLVGGLSLKRGNIVYDVSVQGSLDEIRERIQQG
jgi:F-type H+-transporting ATPase subunit delta